MFITQLKHIVLYFSFTIDFSFVSIRKILSSGFTMKLKRLEIAGFKSFRDKIVLDFSLDVSAIVGPNGCGKSNITDAIRWVMGEQRVKVLRGRKMDDVIFNGSEGSGPVGMAEVSMILSNENQNLRSQYADCSEVCVSRKLFRDGESEYSINRVPCRLLDVREFFMDTGIGARSYSFIEQNSIATLIEAGPGERRQFIEEAAGISKYKSRKDAAVRKMEATKQNLLRLQDITREVKGQLNALSKQAKRAEEYRDLKNEFKDTELTLALQTFSSLFEKEKNVEGVMAAHSSEEISLRAKLDKIESALEELKMELLAAEKSISIKQENLYELRNSVAVKEQSVEFNKGRMSDIAARTNKNFNEIESLEERLKNTAAEIDSLLSSTAYEGTRIQSVARDVDRKQSQLDEVKTEEEKLKKSLDASKSEYFEAVTKKSNLKTIIMQWEKQTAELRRRDEKDLIEFQDYEAKKKNILDRLDVLRSHLRSDEELQLELNTQKNTFSAEIEELEDEIRSLDENIQKLKEDIGRKATRLASLKEFHDGYQWCSEGTKNIMSVAGKSGNGKTIGDGLKGLVADFIDVPREYETAIEAVLGERLQYVVVKSQEDGADAIDYLRVNSLGRGSFVPFEVRHSNAVFQNYEHLKNADRLIEKVRVRDEYRTIIEYLLGDVLLIQNLKHGIALWRQNGFVGTFVTPDGDIINPNGVLTGGSNSSNEKSLLRNKREMTELNEALAALEYSLREKNRRRADAVQLLAEREAGLDSCVADLHTLEIDINGRRKDCERYESEMSLIDQRMKIITFNRDNLDLEKSDILENIERTSKDLAAIEQQEMQLNEIMTDGHKKSQDLRIKLDEAEKELTAGKILLASIEEKNKAAIAAIDKLKTARDVMSKEIADKRKEMDSYGIEKETLRNRISDDEEALRISYDELSVMEDELVKMRETYQQDQSSLTGLDTQSREIKKELDAQIKDINTLELEKKEVSLQANNLNDAMLSKYNVELKTLVQEFEPLNEEAADALCEKLRKYREKLETFGEVNLLALNEYDEIKQRHDFLIGQLDDVNESLSSLQRTITRINKISRARFSEAFKAVNEHFQIVFARIFRGGKANLRLTDENDLLETGVEIDIQIAGKKAQNISLLSGGEKSLAAIALVFAIILHRPSPFLVLDEVDAALDDANVSLFNELIRDISAKSQIIMVTHNKKAMEAADHLFGVSMQHDGISSLVSVSLN